MESTGRCYYDVLENVSYLVRNLQERAIRRGHAEPAPCLGVSNTSFVYSSQKCDSNYPFANSACRCHDSTACPSGGVPIRARRTAMMHRSSCLSIAPPERLESPQKLLWTGATMVTLASPTRLRALTPPHERPVRSRTPFLVEQLDRSPSSQE
jgi:hypothetical protein